jgi:hypothetical protein
MQLETFKNVNSCNGNRDNMSSSSCTLNRDIISIRSIYKFHIGAAVLS